MVRLHSLSCSSWTLCLTLVLTPLACADRACVQFDVAHTVAAQEVSTEQFLADNPDEKLIRIRIPVSSLVRLSSEESLLQYLYVVSGQLTKPFQIVDYAPKTQLATDVDGLITTEQGEDQSASIGINALAPHGFPIKSDASAKLSEGSRSTQRMKILPPKHLLSASGTMHRGASAYFKLKPSTQTTLEGTKTFEIVVRVRSNWRAGLLYVNCAAFGKPRGSGLVASDSLVCGQHGFVVGAHLAGDETAKLSVEKLAATQRQLTILASQQIETIEKRRFPSIGHKIGAALSVVKPRIPDSWLNELLTSGDFHSFERHLPRNIREAATTYREARSQVLAFAG